MILKGFSSVIGSVLFLAVDRVVSSYVNVSAFTCGWQNRHALITYIKCPVPNIVININV
jgi:hypothetical protein